MSSLAAQRRAHRAASSEEVGWAGRAGLAARGVVYAIIGLLALKLALGDGGKATNQQGALHTIARQPFGKLLLILVAVGLFGYAAWRGAWGAVGPVSAGDDDAKERVAGVVSGLAYAALCVTAIKILMGSGG